MAHSAKVANEKSSEDEQLYLDMNDNNSANRYVPMLSDNELRV